MAGPDAVIDVPPAPPDAQPTTIELSDRTWYYLTIKLIGFSVEQLGIRGDEGIPIKRLVRSYLPWIPTPLLQGPLIQTQLYVDESRRRRAFLRLAAPAAEEALDEEAEREFLAVPPEAETRGEPPQVEQQRGSSSELTNRIFLPRVVLPQAFLA